MRLSSAFSTSPATALALILLPIAAAHPFERVDGADCPTESVKISMDISCGETNAVIDCVQNYGSQTTLLQECLEEAGCVAEEAQTEAIWVVERCQSSTLQPTAAALELRHVVARETTTATTSTETSTSSSSSTSSESTATTSSSTTTTSSSSSATTTSSSSSSSSSTSASSTTSSTSTSTSSTSTSTSTSSSSASTKGMTSISYFVAVLMALFASGCIGGICFSCCSERNARKKTAKAAEAKEALLSSH